MSVRFRTLLSGAAIFVATVGACANNSADAAPGSNQFTSVLGRRSTISRPSYLRKPIPITTVCSRIPSSAPPSRDSARRWRDWCAAARSPAFPPPR